MPKRAAATQHIIRARALLPFPARIREEAALRPITGTTETRRQSSSNRSHGLCNRGKTGSVARGRTRIVRLDRVSPYRITPFGRALSAFNPGGRANRKGTSATLWQLIPGTDR